MIIDLPAVDPALAVLGRRLRLVREARGFSLHQLADDVRVSPARLGLAEQGRVRLASTELHALIGALHISLRLLYADADVAALRPL